MSFTGRPSSPPLALMSSSQIFCASSADLPLGASPPVSAMLKPILIGSRVCADAGAASRAAASTTKDAPANDRSFMLCGMTFLPLVTFVRILSATRAARLVGAGKSARRLHAFHQDGFHLTRTVAAEGRSPVVLGRGETGDALFEARKLDDDEPGKLVRPFHDPKATAARQ